jgi:hypothetical protein
MRTIQKAKDGGPKSPVDAFFLVEIKWLFSIALLRFNIGGREEFHTHAFHALTWFLWGGLVEEEYRAETPYRYRRSLWPKFTPRSKNHRVRADKTSWCLTLRGPWAKTWTEHTEAGSKTTFGWGRRILNVEK